MTLPVCPVFTTEPGTGEEQFIFQSGGSHYVWNALSFTLLKIVDPTGIDQIAAAMRDNGGLPSLNLQEVSA